MGKRILTAVIAAVLMICVTGAVFAEETGFADTQTHWAKDTIDKWSGYGVLKGYNGLFRPDANITRADLAIVIARIMNYKSISTNTFKDINNCTKEQSEAILKLNAAGVMLGSGGYMRPFDSISREEASVMIGRAMFFEETVIGALPFYDAADISGWASGMVRTMTQSGYISGFETGYFKPKSSITRAQVVTILDKTINGYYYAKGSYSVSSLGNVVINCTDVELNKVAVTGNLIITEGVGDGNATLKDVTVEGAAYILGGGSKSIKLTGRSRIERLEHLKKGAAAVSYVVEPSSIVREFFVTPESSPVQYEGTLRNIYLNAPNHETKLVNAVVTGITVGNVETRLTIDDKTSISSIYVMYPLKMLGLGNISSAVVYRGGDGSSFERQPKETLLHANTTAFFSGKEYNNHGSVTSYVYSAEESTPPTVSNNELNPSKMEPNAVTIGWSGAADNVTAQGKLRYCLYYSTSPQMNTISEIERHGMMASGYAANLLSARVDRLKAGETYYFNVIVKDENENKSCYKRAIVEIELDDIPPTTAEPGGNIISVTGIKHNEVTLNWEYGFDNVTSQDMLQYSVYRSDQSNIQSAYDCEIYGTLIMKPVENTRKYTASGLTENKTYYFNVVITDEAGNKTALTMIGIVPVRDLTSPSIGDPDVVITNKTERGATLTWSAASDNSSEPETLKYTVYSSNADNIRTVEEIKANGKVVMMSTANRLSFDLTNQPFGVIYYNILVQDEGGNEACYTSFYISFGTDKTPPKVPTPLLTASSLPNPPTSLTISWLAANDTDNVAGSRQDELVYEIYYMNASEKALTDFDSVVEIKQNADWQQALGKSILTANVSGLAENERYYFNVIVKDEAGFESCYTPLRVIMDITPPGVGTGTPNAKADQYSRELTLSWSAGTDLGSPQSALEYAAFSSSFEYTTVAQVESSAQPFDAQQVYKAAITSAKKTVDFGRKQFYYIIVRDESGNKALYPAAEFTLLDTTPPSIKDFAITSSVTPRGTNETEVLLSWSEASDNVTSTPNLLYYVYKTTDPTQFTSVNDILADQNKPQNDRILQQLNWSKQMTSYADTVYDPQGTTYYYYIVVEDSAGSAGTPLTGNLSMYNMCRVTI